MDSILASQPLIRVLHPGVYSEKFARSEYCEEIGAQYCWKAILHGCLMYMHILWAEAWKTFVLDCFSQMFV